jgi:outer membrane biosynthesis protein TonB
MATAQVEVRGLGQEPRFRRFLAVSAALHLALVGFGWFSPRFPRKLDPRTIVVVETSLPAPPRPTPPPKAPEAKPEPAPPQPPEAKPRQEIEEAIVIPAVPREKPRNRPKPTPEPPKKPEPPKPQPPKPAEPQQSAEDVIAAIRGRVGEDEPIPSGGPGVVDPELALYQQRLQNCFYQNWIGLQLYRRRRDLQVEFEVRVTAEGGVLSVSKTRESGEFQLDDSAERAIRKCAPGDKFPPPPRGRTLLHFIFIPGDVI